MTRTLLQILVEDSGQDLIEYALLAALISLVSVVAITALGTTVNKVYGDSTTAFAAS